MIDIKDTTGNLVSINPSLVAYISPACERNHPDRIMVGYCVVTFSGGAQVVVKGSREEVKEIIEWKPPIDITRAA